MKKTINRKKHTKLIIFLILLAAVIVGGLLYLNSERKYPSENKAQHEKKLGDISKQINFPGVLVHEKITDRGCLLDRYMFGESIKCYLDFKKYYKNDQTLESDLQKAGESIGSLGWMESENRSTFYRKNMPSVHIVSFPKGEYSARIEPVEFKLKKGEYLYGVTMHSKYWDCAEDLLDFKPSCEIPPDTIYND